MVKAQSAPEKIKKSPEVLSFEEKVKAEYEKIVPDGSKFDWYKRAEGFVSKGTQNLWKEYQTATNTEKIIIGGVAVVGAYVGLKLLKAAVDMVFDLGKWMMEKITSIRKDSIGLVLKLTLGASAVALTPLLYEAISKGKLSLSDVTSSWDTDGAEGVIKLLETKFPDGVKSISGDVKKYIMGVIGADKFNNWFEAAPEITTPEKAEKPVDTSFLTEATRARLEALEKSMSLKNFTNFISALIDNEGGIVVKEGSIWFMNEAGELLDVSRWLTLQYFSSVKDVLDAGAADPEEIIGAYVQQYVKEVPKFWIAATTFEFIQKLRGKHTSLLIRPAINALTWGAWPIKLIGPAAKLIKGNPAYVRFAKDSVVFLSKSGVNLAKLTAQGSVLVWKGGQFVLSQAARQTARLGLAKTLGAQISKTYTATLGKQVANFTSKKFMSRLLAVAGWKGVVTTALWADDATIVGVLDDIVAVGMTAWLAFDVYDLIKITRRVMKFKSAMAEQQSLEITNIQGVDPQSEAKIKEIESSSQLKESEVLNVFSSMPKANFSITRTNGISEEYLMVRGKIIACKIIENGTIIAEFSEDDVEKLSQELPPPESFEAWEIDYKQDPEKLTAHYRLAFNFVVNQTGWSELDYEILDENKIIVKRKTSDQSIEINRRGKKWFIGSDDETAFDLFQAISMANLINRVEMIILSQAGMPSGDKPFYADKEGLYVARPGFDTTILKGEESSWYNQFYQSQMKLNPDLISDTLNIHYKNYIQSRSRDQMEEYLKDFMPH